jgi:hypothetical protein
MTMKAVRNPNRKRKVRNSWFSEDLNLSLLVEGFFYLMKISLQPLMEEKIRC